MAGLLDMMRKRRERRGRALEEARGAQPSAKPKKKKVVLKLAADDDYNIDKIMNDMYYGKRHSGGGGGGGRRGLRTSPKTPGMRKGAEARKRKMKAGAY